MERQKKKVGRPTKYKEEYCNMLIDHMKVGLSYQSFAAVVHVNIDTLYEWERNFPLFSDSKKTGLSYSCLFWEKMGVSGAAGKLKGFNPAAWIFNMKNRFNWRDKRDIEVNDISKVSDLELKQRAREILDEE